MTGVEIFRAAVPELLAAAAGGDHQIAQRVRYAARELMHWDCPLGLRHQDAWVGVLARKLETPNRFRAHWSLQSSSREKWARLLRASVLQALGVSSWSALEALERRPRCTVPMRLVVVRLVASSREFIRDDDNLAYSRKHLQDCLKPLGLVKDDRREWLTASVVQDVSPTDGPLTVFLLWPAATPLLTGVPHVDRRTHADASGQVPPHDRRAQEGRAVPRVRRRAGPRAVDV